MFRADLRALRNLFRTADGRRALAGNAIVLGCLALGSLAISARLFLADDVRRAVLGDESGALPNLLFATTLWTPTLALLGLGVTQLGSELYKAPQLTVLLTAPISSLAIVARAYARALVAWLLFCLAIGLPPLLGFAQLGGRTGFAPAIALVYPVAALTVVAPIVAVQVLTKVVLARWLSGPRVRVLLTGTYVSACAGLGLLVAVGFFSGEELTQWARATLQQGVELPWLFAAPAALLSRAAGLQVPTGLLASNLALLALPAPLLALAARLYRASYEAQGASGRALGARWAVARRGWPKSPFRSFLARGVVEHLRVRTNLLALAVLGLLTVVLLRNGVAAAPAVTGTVVPVALTQGLRLLFTWHMLVLLVASLCFAAVVGDEQRQLALLATAPFPRRDLLLSKLVGLAWPFLLCLAIVLALGVPVAGVGVPALAVVALGAPPILSFTLGVIAAVGTWPFAVRVHDEVPLANNLRSILPVLLISGASLAGLAGVLAARGAIGASYHGRGWLAELGGERTALVLLGAAWWIGAVVLIYGCRLALANLERVLGPQ